VDLLKKIRAVVSGTVQNMGYRAKVIAIAKVPGLAGFVHDLDCGRVRIIAEGIDGDLDRFIRNFVGSIICLIHPHQFWRVFIRI